MCEDETGALIQKVRVSSNPGVLFALTADTSLRKGSSLHLTTVACAQATNNVYVHCGENIVLFSYRWLSNALNHLPVIPVPCSLDCTIISISRPHYTALGLAHSSRQFVFEG